MQFQRRYAICQIFQTILLKYDFITSFDISSDVKIVFPRLQRDICTYSFREKRPLTFCLAECQQTGLDQPKPASELRKINGPWV